MSAELDERLAQNLATLAKRCRLPGWDGFGAEPVREETVLAAARFLQSLPHGTPPPAIGAEPDGDVALEWYRSPRRTISVSVTADGNLHYAALLGPNKQYGTEVFVGQVPEPILDLVRRVLA
jgi:hypothetical protein